MSKTFAQHLNETCVFYVDVVLEICSMLNVETKLGRVLWCDCTLLSMLCVVVCKRKRPITILCGVSVEDGNSNMSCYAKWITANSAATLSHVAIYYILKLGRANLKNTYKTVTETRSVSLSVMRNLLSQYGLVDSPHLPQHLHFSSSVMPSKNWVFTGAQTCIASFKFSTGIVSFCFILTIQKTSSVRFDVRSQRETNCNTS